MLPKIYKRLYNLPEEPVISNCVMPTEKAPDFVDFDLKSIMQGEWPISGLKRLY